MTALDVQVVPDPEPSNLDACAWPLPVPGRSTRAQRELATSELVLRLAQGPDDATRAGLREALVLVNRPVAEAIAARYQGRGVPLDDLRQIAFEGLVKAVSRFEPNRGHHLLTFVVPSVRGEVRRYFRDRAWMVRPPRQVQELQYRLAHATADLVQRLGRDPESAELMTELGVSAADLDAATSFTGAFTPISLDQPVGDGNATALVDVVAGLSDDAETEARLSLRPLVQRLAERDRRVVYLRFWEDRTQAEIGLELGVTQMQVSRILQRILRDLRSAHESTNPPRTPRIIPPTGKVRTPHPHPRRTV